MIYVSSLVIRIMNRLGMLSFLRVGYKLKMLGRTFKIPVLEDTEGILFYHKIGEPYLLEVFQELYKSKNYIFLDGGVNFGQTLLKVKAIRMDAHYIGFEPSILCSYYASRLIKVNNIPNTTLIKCALSNSTGVITLHSETEGDMRASIVASDNPGANIYSEIVPSLTLDSLLELITAKEKDILLKVDVEGAEWMVFEGGEQLIDKYRPIVIFENLPSDKDLVREKQQQSISAFFKEKNFDLFLLDEEKHSRFRIDAIDNKHDFSKTNYLAIPTEYPGQ